MHTRMPAAGAPQPVGRGAVPADALLHPVVLAAIALLLLNDHQLKAAYPGFVTGKLSDVAGLAFFPLVIVGIAEVVAAALGRWRGPSGVLLARAIVATAVGFVAVKTIPAAAFAFGWCTGAAGWIVALALSTAGGPAAGPMTVGLVRVDPTDLIALPALAIPWAIGRRRVTAAEPRAAWHRPSP